MRGNPVLRALALSVFSARAAYAACDCGYFINATDYPRGAVLFTEVLETDFLHVEVNNSQGLGSWTAQAYNVTPSHANGPYGKAAEVENVRSNVIASPSDWAGDGVHGPNPGLNLWNRAALIAIPGTNDSMVPMAEIVSTRNDMLYGSFRVGMMTTRVSGTCGAFFFYLNDSMEIDMEFLSKQQGGSNGFVNLVIQSPASAQQGFVNDDSPDFNKTSLGFAPQAGYNEFRFDWLPSRVDFYTNGRLMSSVTENVPDAAGSLHLIHWSNGNDGWSSGPPKEDAALTISYVKAYFNSSKPEITRESLRDCKVGGSMCEVPTQKIPPNLLQADGNETGKTFFFTDQNTTRTSGAGKLSVAWLSLLFAAARLLVGL